MEDAMVHAEQYTPPPKGWQRNFIILSATLASTILLKIAGIQYLEYIYYFQILYLIFLFAQNNFKARIYRPLLVLALFYAVFAILATGSAVVSLRNNFYYPSNLPLLRYPVLIAMTRVSELVADVTAMLYLANEFRKNLSYAIFAMKIYFWAGAASAIYSVVTYPLNVFFHTELGTYLGTHRMRGFYNEGGPYGNYVVSVLLVGLVLYARRWEPRGRLVFGLFLVVVALLGSQSKSSVFAGLFVFAINALLARGLKRRILLFGSLFLLIGLASITYDFSRQMRAYQRGVERYEKASYAAGTDLNYVAGRVAGLFLVPRMIQEHPYLGVGWGNYGIVRNAPEYRGGSVWVDIDDAPGLGLLGTTAEVGIPLTLLLVVCLMIPYYYLLRMNAPLHLKSLALLQPTVHIFGAQLNVTYPWVTSAFAIGIAFALYRHSQSGNVMPGGPVAPAGIL